MQTGFAVKVEVQHDDRKNRPAAGWGDAVVERLAADLRAEFPDLRGFSPRNIWDMRLHGF